MAKRTSKETKAGAGDSEAEGFALHPRFTEALSGHGAAEETFLRAFNAGALHHAWLVTGERGIGKATFAYRAARFLLSRDAAAPTPAETLDVPQSHPAVRQIAAGAHTSLFVLGEAPGTAAAASIGVDEVRRLRSFLSLTSPGGWRAMIVDPANDLTIASANALLKAIEEPQARTVFFLIGHGASTVMPTIRSRCVKLVLRPLGLADFSGGGPGRLRGGGHRLAGRPGARKAPQDFRGLAGPRRGISGWRPAAACRHARQAPQEHAAHRFRPRAQPHPVGERRPQRANLCQALRFDRGAAGGARARSAGRASAHGKKRRLGSSLARLPPAPRRYGSA